MEYRILGRTGLKVGAIALGCEGFADKTAEEVRADFEFAIRNGINFLGMANGLALLWPALALAFLASLRWSNGYRARRAV